MSEISNLKNLGEKSRMMLADLGITTREELARWGPVKVWHALKTAGRPVTMVMVYAVQGALLDVHWNALPPELKERLKDQCRRLEDNSRS